MKDVSKRYNSDSATVPCSSFLVLMGTLYLVSFHRAKSIRKWRSPKRYFTDATSFINIKKKQFTTTWVYVFILNSLNIRILTRRKLTLFYLFSNCNNTNFRKRIDPLEKLCFILFVKYFPEYVVSDRNESKIRWTIFLFNCYIQVNILSKR